MNKKAITLLVILMCIASLIGFLLGGVLVDNIQDREITELQDKMTLYENTQY